MDILPIIVLAVMITSLLMTPDGMVAVCPLAALAVIIAAGGQGGELIAHAAPSIAVVLVTMGATQLAIRYILAGGAGERISARIAETAAHPRLCWLPAEFVLPAILVPTAMVLAGILHNITSLMVLAPLAIRLCKNLGVASGPVLAGMLIASNLGGASMAFGDTPAILQRALWGFTPATFAVNMLPRNLVVLAFLTGFTAFCARRARSTQGANDWRSILARVRTLDDARVRSHYGPDDQRKALIGTVALIAFVAAQFIWTHGALAISSVVFASLVVLTPAEDRLEAYTVLGIESIVVIISLFIVSEAVAGTHAVRALGHLLEAPGGLRIELVAYALTTGISADGAAALLAPLVHQVSGGGLEAAWALACGICAGSSTLLTAASAGPILNGISREEHDELTFKAYARFGVPFSFVMLLIYAVTNLALRT